MRKRRVLCAMVKCKDFVFVVGHPDIGDSIIVIIRDSNAHAAIRVRLIVKRNAAQNPLLEQFAVTIVQIEKVIRGIVGNIDIKIRVVIGIE